MKLLGDDDLFGDLGDIFSDILSKFKGFKKKKFVIIVFKDDIFVEGVVIGGL